MGVKIRKTESERCVLALETRKPSLTLAKAVPMTCWEWELLPWVGRELQGGKPVNADHLSGKSGCEGKNGDGCWRGEQGSVFSAVKKRHMEMYRVECASVILISCYLIFENCHMLREALVSCSNGFAFYFPFRILFL